MEIEGELSPTPAKQDDSLVSANLWGRFPLSIDDFVAFHDAAGEVNGGTGSLLEVVVVYNERRDLHDKGQFLVRIDGEWRDGAGEELSHLREAFRQEKVKRSEQRNVNRASLNGSH